MLTICSLEIPSEHTARREKRRRYHSPLYMQKDETETENQGSRLAKGDNDITPSKSSCKWSSLASTSIYKQSTIALERHCLAAGRNKVQYSVRNMGRSSSIRVATKACLRLVSKAIFKLPRRSSKLKNHDRKQHTGKNCLLIMIPLTCWLDFEVV